MIIYIFLAFILGLASGVLFHQLIVSKTVAALEKGKKELREELDKAKEKLK